jgi:hypothetical protein
MKRVFHSLFVSLLVYLILPAAAMAQVIIGPGPGGNPDVHLIEPGGTRSFSVFYPWYIGGVNVTLGDVNGDGTMDVIAAAGSLGGPHVRVFSGTDLSELASFYAFEPSFVGGVRVAAGDVNGDGRADIIVAAGPGGGPQVRVFSGLDLSELANFYAYPDAFTGGVTVAAGDVDGDGLADIVTGAGAGGGPHVRVFSGADLRELASFYAYDADFGGGVSVAAGDFNGDGLSDIVTGAGPGGGPHVRVFSGLDLGELVGFYGLDPTFSGGVGVAAGDIDGDGRVDLILGAGPGGENRVRILSGVDFSELESFVFPAAMGAGIAIGSTGDAPGVRFTSPATTTFTVGSPGTFTVTTAGGPVPAITSSGALPPGVTFTDNGDRTATLAGTPAAGSGGSYALTFTADNGIGTPRTQTFTLIVNQAPAITSAAATAFTVGAAGSFSVTTSGFPLPTIARGGATLPAGVTWVDNGNGTGTLSGTPEAGTGGSYAFTFTADNGVSPAASQPFTLTVSGAPSFTSAPTTTFTVGSPGSFTVSAVGTPTPTVAVAGTLPAGVTFVANADGTGTLSGTPAAGTGGVHSITFTAANGILPNGTQAFTLTVNQAPAITSGTTATFVIGTPGTFTVTTSGFPAPSIALGGVTLPAGLTFADNGNGTGTLTGTPAAGTGGSYALTFTATNPAGTSAPQNFILTVNGPSAFTSASTTTFTVGVPGSFTVTAAGTPTPAITLTGGTLPTGVTFNSSTGTLSGTPAAGTGGVHALTFTASNGIPPDSTQAFTLIVNEAPAITSAAGAMFTVGAAGSFTVTTSGFPAPTIAIGGVALPASVTFVDNGNGTGTLSGTPGAATGGTYTLSFTASNSVAASAPQTFTLTVNQAPAVTSANTTNFSVGVAGSFTVTATGFPAPTITHTGGTLPAGVTFAAGVLSGTPASGTAGAHALTFTIANAAGTITQNFTLNVLEGPVITSASSVTFTLGAPNTFTVTASGFPPPTLTQAGTLPAGVTWVDNGNGTGTLSGTPQAGTGGSHALTFTATNGSGSAVQNFTLTITQPPSITSANTTTFTVGAAGTFTVTATGVPAPTLSVTGTLPAGVTFDTATGILSGTPAAGTGGSYALTFTASNGVLPNATQPFTLLVIQAPAITSAANVTFTVGAAGSFSVTTSGFPAPTIARGGVALPAGLTFVDNLNGTGTLAGTPAAGTGGSYAITFTATNTVGSSPVQAFTLIVQAPPAITSATSTTFTVGTPGSFTVTTTGFPVPTVSQAGTLPTGITFTPATNVLGGTATQTGVFPLVFTATNAVPPDATQNFTLNVICPTITVNPATMPEGLFMVAYPGVTFTQTGSTGSTITWSATGLPLGLAISPTTGAVSGTPTTTVAGAAVVVTATDNFGCTGTRSTTITVRPVAGADSFTGGVGNTQFVVGTAVTTPAVAKAGNVKSNDNGPGTLTVAFAATSANAGTIAEGTDGTFIYTPAVAFGGPTDTFTYTLTDGNGVTNTGTVTISLSGMVWYVNNAGGNGDGRSHSPFNTLANAATPSAAGSQIYVHTGTGTTTGSLAMDANQTIHGAGAAFALNDLLIAAGTPPTLSGTVTLANNDIVRAVNFLGAAPAMTATNALTGPVTVDQVSVTGGTTALSLTNVSGAVTVTNATFTNTSGAEVLINQGTGNVSVAATLSSNAGRSIDIQNRTGGIVTFSGPITDTGQGIFLNANTGSTINFTGGLALSTTTNPAFTATGGGTVSATQNNTTIVNTITTTTGTALNVASTTIGASGLTFRSIAANGAPSGIVLNGTGASGSLSVTGSGSADSGGVIQFTTGAAISLTNTLHPQFTRMNIHDIGQNGIDGQQVTNFTLTNTTINNVGTAAAGQYNENNIAFNDAGAFTSSSVSGTVTITNNTLTNARRHGIQIENGTGTIASLTISNNVLTSSTSAAASLGTAILVLAQGSATLNAHVTTGTIASNTISNFPSGEGILVAGGSGNGSNNTSSTLGATGTPISITGNAINGGASRMGSNAIRAAFNGQQGVANFSITNNGTAGSPITNIQGQGISVFMGGSVTGTTTINNNFIVANQTLAAGTQGLAVQIDDGPAGSGTSAADYNVVVTNNSVSAYEGNGIRAIARASLGKMDVTIQNNTVGTPILGNRNGIRIDSGSAAGDVTVCLAISGNTSDGSGVNAGIGLRKQGTVATVNDFGIVGLSPSPTTGANAATRVITDNPAGGGVDIISGDNFVSCTISP